MLALNIVFCVPLVNTKIVFIVISGRLHRCYDAYRFRLVICEAQADGNLGLLSDSIKTLPPLFYFSTSTLGSDYDIRWFAFLQEVDAGIDDVDVGSGWGRTQGFERVFQREDEQLLF